jgi:hypothetical protein
VAQKGRQSTIPGTNSGIWEMARPASRVRVIVPEAGVYLKCPVGAGWYVFLAHLPVSHSTRPPKGLTAHERLLYYPSQPAPGPPSLVRGVDPCLWFRSISGTAIAFSGAS